MWQSTLLRGPRRAYSEYMTDVLAFEAQVKFASNEQWQIVAVSLSRRHAAGLAAVGFRTVDAIGRLPSQVRVVPRPIRLADGLHTAA